MSVGKKPGYRKTAAGWIPKDWGFVRLGNVAQESRLRNGGQLSDERLCGVLKSQGLVPMRDRVKGESTDRCRIVAPNAFAYNPMRLNIGSIARNRAPNAVMVSPDYVVFGPDPNRLLPDYLDQVRRSGIWENFVGASGDGSVRVRIYFDHLARLELPLPPIDEQQKIASILTAVDDKLDVIARQITATQALKQGLMQTLFTKGVGTQDADGRWVPHTKFKQTPLGEIPASWTVGQIGDYIAALSSGVSVNAEDRAHQSDEIGVLKVSSVFGGRFHPHEHKTVVLPVEVLRVAEPVQEGSIIISRANTPSLVGESAYVDASYPDLFLPDKLWQTKPSKLPHSVRWLAFYLQSPLVRQEISKAATGTSGSMKNISKPSFLCIPMPLMPVEEQHQISEVLSTLSSKQDMLIAKQSHYQTLKRGLMQKLLTGQWRVKVDNAEHTLSAEAA